MVNGLNAKEIFFINKTGNYSSNPLKTFNLNEELFCNNEKKINNQDEYIETTYGEDINYMSAIYDTVTQMAMNEASIKQVGCTALQPAARSCTNKATAIAANIGNSLKSLDAEIQQISQNKNLSQEEIESKIALINAKKEALIEEGEAKINAIGKLSDAVLNLIGPVMQLKGTGADISVMTEMITELLGSINTSSSSLSDAKNVDEVKKMSENNMKNIFGSDKDTMSAKYINELDKRIDEAKKKLKSKDIDAQEKEKLKTEIEVYTIQKKCFKDLFKNL